jgi:hypothetical protein
VSEGKKLTEKQVRRALNRLEKGMPPDLWIFAADGGLWLMRCDENGERAYVPGWNSGGVDPAYIVESYRVPSDGGDW